MLTVGLAVLQAELLDELGVPNLDQLLVDVLLIQVRGLVALVEDNCVLLLLADVADVFLRAVVVLELPFHFLVQVEEATLLLEVGRRVLVEDQLGHVDGFAGDDELVEAAAMVAAAAYAFALAL